MPACIMHCENCQSERVRNVSDVNFGIILEKGMVKLECEQCGQPTSWKLTLHRRAPRAASPHTGPLRVLAVDDDEATLQILKRILSQRYEAELASSADEVMNKLQTENFDVIVSDIRMPGFTGANLFRFLTVFMPEYATRVVFLTGDTSEQTLQFLEESGCPYTFKPIDLQELQKRISQVA